jgi:hypothetical protein
MHPNRKERWWVVDQVDGFAVLVRDDLQTKTKHHPQLFQTANAFLPSLFPKKRQKIDNQRIIA